jgi:type I restriction enzyme S subunit
MNKLIAIEIGNLGTTITGKTPSSNNPEDFGSEYMFITPSDSFDDKMIFKTNRYLSDVGINKLKNKVLPPKSVLVSCIGSAMGKIIMNHSSAISNQQINSIIINRSFDSDYIYYNLKNNYKLLRNAAAGSTALPMLNKTDFDKLVINIHKDLKDQRKIASVLSALDSKIEVNNRINAELEAMAKTLYDYWFVQFDFPVVTSSGVEKPYKTSGGKMVWSEDLKREIPEGWEVKKINSIIEVKDGTHDSPKPKSVGYRLITSKNLQVSGLDFDNANLISEEDYLSIIKRSNVETGDILFSMIGNIGTIYKIEEKEINFAIKNVALYKTSRMQEHKNYVYMFLKSIDMDRYMKNVISGSIQKFIGLNSLRETPILSNEWLIKKYNEITFTIFEKLENLKLENQKLTELRDWLLPMLMNGQVKVSEL